MPSRIGAVTPAILPRGGAAGPRRPPRGRSRHPDGPAQGARPRRRRPALAAHLGRALRDGGCDHVLVVLGAQAEDARSVLGEMGHRRVAEDWAEGMSASLSAGSRRTARPRPGLRRPSARRPPRRRGRVVSRVLTAVGTDPSSLGRATYDGPDTPSSSGWTTCPACSGDRATGEPATTSAGTLTLVECADLATGRDVDTPRNPVRAPGGTRPAPDLSRGRADAAASAASAAGKHCSGGVTRPAPTWPVPATRRPCRC